MTVGRVEQLSIRVVSAVEPAARAEQLSTRVVSRVEPTALAEQLTARVVSRTDPRTVLLALEGAGNAAPRDVNPYDARLRTGAFEINWHPTAHDAYTAGSYHTLFRYGGTGTSIYLRANTATGPDGKRYSFLAYYRNDSEQWWAYLRWEPGAHVVITVDVPGQRIGVQGVTFYPGVITDANGFLAATLAPDLGDGSLRVGHWAPGVDVISPQLVENIYEAESVPVVVVGAALDGDASASLALSLSTSPETALRPVALDASAPLSLSLSAAPESALVAVPLDAGASLSLALAAAPETLLAPVAAVLEAEASVALALAALPVTVALGGLLEVDATVALSLSLVGSPEVQAGAVLDAGATVALQLYAAPSVEGAPVGGDAAQSAFLVFF